MREPSENFSTKQCGPKGLYFPEMFLEKKSIMRKRSIIYQESEIIQRKWSNAICLGLKEAHLREVSSGNIFLAP